MAADKADALATDKKGDLYLFGTLREIGIRRSRTARIGPDTLAKGYIFFAGLSAKGAYRGVVTSNIMVHTREVNLGLIRGSGDIFYGTGFMHYGLPTPFQRFDKAFGGGETHGGSPFIGQLRNPAKEKRQP
ncbi:MAG TPA: hypothetical protein VK927_01215 [Adhaeribacter sp.]|nr:hypothetical protein [Adhaeribacter sp.]